MKIESLSTLQDIKEGVMEEAASAKLSILVCGGTGCKSSSADQIIENLKKRSRRVPPRKYCQSHANRLFWVL